MGHEARILKALEDYQANQGTKWKGNEAAFYLTEIKAIYDTGEGDIATAIMHAMQAGFMVGYRKGKADAKKEPRKDPKPAKDDGTRADLKSLDKATLDALANMDCLEYYHFCAGKGVSLNYYTPVFDNMNHYPEGAF